MSCLNSFKSHLKSCCKNRFILTGAVRRQGGFSLVEVLVVTAVGAVIMAGTMKVLDVSLQSSRATRSSLTEQQLRRVVDNLISKEESCKGNLKPHASHLVETTTGTGQGEVKKLEEYTGATAGTELLKPGLFKGDLEIIKMELIGSGNPKGNKVDRTFAVFYKKPGMGKLSTLGGGDDCKRSSTEVKTDDCYFVSCKVKYELDTAGTVVNTCRSQDCMSTGGGGGGGVCRNPDGTHNLFCPENAGPNTTGDYNTFIGVQAGNKTTTGRDNVFIGFEAGYKNLKDITGPGSAYEASRNVYIGYQAGYKGTTARDNVFIGWKAGYNIETTTDAVYIGAGAGGTNKSAWGNTFVGGWTGGSVNTGPNNSFFGYAAGSRTTTGGNNTFLGYNAGHFNFTGRNNTFVGSYAGYSSQSSATPPVAQGTGNNNTFLGYQAGYSNTTGNQNLFIGMQAGQNTTTGTNNLFIGYQAGHANLKDITGSASPTLDASYNIYIGNQAGHKNTDGNSNIFIGHSTGASSTTVKESLYIGASAGYTNLTGAGNTFIGTYAGNKATGEFNTFVGHVAGQNLASGNKNTFIGYFAGQSSASSLNTFVGYKAGAVTIASKNTFIGSEAGLINTTGQYNVFVGFKAGEANTTENDNVFIGHTAGKVSTGKGNTFLGKSAGYANTTGSHNIFIGKDIASKNNKGGVDKTKDRQLNIGNLIFGRQPMIDSSNNFSGSAKNFFTSTTVPKYLNTTTGAAGIVINGNLFVEGSVLRVSCSGTCKTPLLVAENNAVAPSQLTASLNQLYFNQVSSRVFKRNIVPFTDYNKALQDILNTPLFNYQYKKNHADKTRMGIIAEDLPKHLQLKTRGQPVMPDMPTITGTLWAGLKALYNQLQDFKKEILTKLQQIKDLLTNTQKQLNNLNQKIKTLEHENKKIKKQNQHLKKQINIILKTKKAS